jgi:hypothetical protein
MKKGHNYITTSGMANFMDFNVKTLEKSFLLQSLLFCNPADDDANRHGQCNGFLNTKNKN